MKNSIHALIPLAAVLFTTNVAAMPLWSRSTTPDATVLVSGTNQTATFNLSAERLRVRTVDNRTQKFRGRFRKIAAYKNILVGLTTKGRLNIFADGPDGVWRAGDLFPLAVVAEVNDALFQKILYGRLPELSDFDVHEDSLVAVGRDGRIYTTTHAESQFTFQPLHGVVAIHRYGAPVSTFVAVGRESGPATLVAAGQLIDTTRAAIGNQRDACSRGLALAEAP